MYYTVLGGHITIPFDIITLVQNQVFYNVVQTWDFLCEHSHLVLIFLVAFLAYLIHSDKSLGFKGSHVLNLTTVY